MLRFALLVCCCCALMAAESDRIERMFKRLDRNGDGRIVKEEVPERMQRLFTVMDSDGDGQIVAEEHRHFMEERMSGGRQGARQRSDDVGADERQQDPDGKLRPDHPDVPYGPHPKQAFDVYLAPGPGPHAVAVFIHGGGFRGGDKRGINVPILRGLLERGISVVSINYRLSDVGPYPMPMRDGARAVQTIRAWADHYDIDPDRLAVFGGSAGAGISQWLALHDDLGELMSADPVAMQSTRPCCAVGMAAQTSYDPRVHAEIFGFDHVDGALIPFFGMSGPGDVTDERFHPLFEDSSPITHLGADDPPLLLVYSQPDSPVGPDMPKKDIIHHPAFGRHMLAKAEELGADVRMLRREDMAGGGPEALNEAVVAFIAEHLLGDGAQ